MLHPQKCRGQSQVVRPADQQLHWVQHPAEDTAQKPSESGALGVHSSAGLKQVSGESKALSTS